MLLNYLYIIYKDKEYLYVKDERMDTKHSTFWEHLANEIEPLMQIGELLINETLPLLEKYQIDSASITDWEGLPVSFQNEIRSCIVALMDKIPDKSLMGEILQSDVLYQKVFEMLEAQYARLDKRDVSARTFLLHLMEEVMNGSIESGTMYLSDWHELFEKRKEASRVENVGEYVYKKLSLALCPEKKMSVYDFFFNKTSRSEIDKLLEETKNSLLLASNHRGQTKKRGQGMSRFIVDCIFSWQDAGLVKPLKSVFPFCHCLQDYWNNEVNLGTRQGLEATYKQRV